MPAAPSLAPGMPAGVSTVSKWAATTTAGRRPGSVPTTLRSGWAAVGARHGLVAAPGQPPAREGGGAPRGRRARRPRTDPLDLHPLERERPGGVEAVGRGPRGGPRRARRGPRVAVGAAAPAADDREAVDGGQDDPRPEHDLHHEHDHQEPHGRSDASAPAGHRVSRSR